MLENIKEYDCSFDKKIKIYSYNYDNQCDKVILDNIEKNYNILKNVIVNCLNINERRMLLAQNIITRCKQRHSIGFPLLPRQRLTNENSTEQEKEEYKDCKRLLDWKNALKLPIVSNCILNIKEFLDIHLPSWNITREERYFRMFEEIVKRARIRESNGLNKYPGSKKSIDHKVELQDHHKLYFLKSNLKSNPNLFLKKYDKIIDLLDKEFLGWRYTQEEKDMILAKEIILESNKREQSGTNIIPKKYYDIKNRSDEQDKESYHRFVLDKWNKEGCTKEIKDLLDKNIKGWNIRINRDKIKQAEEIYTRAIERNKIKKYLLPIKSTKKDYDKQENKDYETICIWRKSYYNKDLKKCPIDLQNYLNSNLPGWFIYSRKISNS
jgi:hypothetical protein